MYKIAISPNKMRDKPFHTNASKLVWFCLLRDVNEDYVVHTSALGISKEIGLNEKTVRNVLRSFSENDLIEYVNPNGNPILSPKKVRYMGCILKLKAINICTDSKTSKIRKISDIESDIISDISIIKQPQIPPRPVTYTPSQTLDFQTIVEILRADASWRESIQRAIGLTEMQLDDALDRYPDHCVSQGEPEKTLKDAKRHIANWLRRQKYSTATIQHETLRQDRFSERRGTDPAANRPEDYTATL